MASPTLIIRLLPADSEADGLGTAFIDAAAKVPATFELPEGCTPLVGKYRIEIHKGVMGVRLRQLDLTGSPFTMWVPVSIRYSSENPLTDSVGQMIFAMVEMEADKAEANKAEVVEVKTVKANVGGNSSKEPSSTLPPSGVKDLSAKSPAGTLSHIVAASGGGSVPPVVGAASCGATSRYAASCCGKEEAWKESFPCHKGNKCRFLLNTKEKTLLKGKSDCEFYHPSELCKTLGTKKEWKKFCFFCEIKECTNWAHK